MKLLHVLRTGSFAYGAERTVRSMLRGLVERGHSVHVLLVIEMRAGHTPDDLLERLRATGTTLSTFQMIKRLPFGAGRKIRELCLEIKPDIIHSHGYKLDLASLVSRAPAHKVATVHGWCSRSARERFYEWVGVQCLKRMDGVIALCEDYRGRLVRRGVKNDIIHVAHVPVNAGAILSTGQDYRSDWGAGPDDVVVSQIGRLSPEKRPDLFIAVAKRVHVHHPKTRFVLVGGGPEFETFQADPAAREGWLVLNGYASNIADVLRATDVVASCSTTEGLPGALLEAGAIGRPVVATDVGGVSEIVEDGATGLLCPSGNADALTAALERLINDKELRTRMGDAAQERIQSVFNEDVCTDRLIEVYEKVLAEK